VSPRPRSVEDADIFAAIESVISRVGPTALTVALVAKEAGLAPSSLIQRFGSKRSLLLAFATRAADGPTEVFVRAREAETNPLRAIRWGLRAMAGSVRTRERLSNHLAFLQIDLNDAAFRKLARAHGDAMRTSLTLLLAEARGKGLTDLDPKRAAVDLQVIYNGALVTWAVHGQGSLDEFLDRSLDAVLQR
jgi:AcrR family transcriptional regulator